MAALAAGTCCIGSPSLFGAGQTPKDYQRANTDWLARCRFGIGVHWTAQTVPRNGSALSFQKAVDAFDLRKFVDQFRDSPTSGHHLNRWRCVYFRFQEGECFR
jgi:hypothetical protein